ITMFGFVSVTPRRVVFDRRRIAEECSKPAVARISPGPSRVVPAGTSIWPAMLMTSPGITWTAFPAFAFSRACTAARESVAPVGSIPAPRSGTAAFTRPSTFEFAAAAVESVSMPYCSSDSSAAFTLWPQVRMSLPGTGRSSTIGSLPIRALVVSVQDPDVQVVAVASGRQFLRLLGGHRVPLPAVVDADTLDSLEFLRHLTHGRERAIRVADDRHALPVHLQPERHVLPSADSRHRAKVLASLLPVGERPLTEPGLGSLVRR